MRLNKETKPCDQQRFYARIPRILTLSVVLLLLAGGLSWGFSFEPITRTFAPSGRESSRSFRLNNDGNQFIALRISMLAREIDIQGNEHRTPAEDLFHVYPQRVVLRPHTSQTVRVQWKGPASLQQERCFRILVEQLPVDFGEGEQQEGSGVKIQFRYLGSVYVTPEGAKADVVVAKSSIVTSDDSGSDARRLQWVFHNRGNKHAILSELQLSVSSETGTKVEYGPGELEGINGENLLPGGHRRFSVTLPGNFEGETADVTFDYQQLE